MVNLKIAFRNIFRQKRRSFFTLLTIFGGFVLASISIGWATGNYSRIIDMFTRNRLGHIQVHKKGYLDKPSLYDTIDNYISVGEKINGIKYVEAWSPRIFSAGIASVGDKTTGVRIIAVDPALEERATRFSKKIIKGTGFPSHDLKTVILGQGLAKVLNADINSGLVILTQASDGSLANDLYKVIGISASGDEMTDRTAVYLNIKEAQELLALKNKAHEIIVILKDIDDIKKAVPEIGNAIDNGGLSVKPWQEFAKSFYRAMKADLEGMWIMLFIIIVIVSVGVLNTVLMSVLERRREYGMLKAIGTRPSDIIKIVLLEVNLIGVASIIIGAIVGVLGNYLLSIYGFPLPHSFTYGGMEFSKLYAKVTFQSLYLPAIAVVLSSNLVSVFPAIKAARIEPVRAMRMH